MYSDAPKGHYTCLECHGHGAHYGNCPSLVKKEWKITGVSLCDNEDLVEIVVTKRFKGEDQKDHLDRETFVLDRFHPQIEAYKEMGAKPVRDILQKAKVARMVAIITMPDGKMIIRF